MESNGQIQNVRLDDNDDDDYEKRKRAVASGDLCGGGGHLPNGDPPSQIRRRQS